MEFPVNGLQGQNFKNKNKNKIRILILDYFKKKKYMFCLVI